MSENERETARDLTHRAYMSLIGSTHTGRELEEILVDRLVNRYGYDRSYAVRVVREYLDS